MSKGRIEILPKRLEGWDCVKCYKEATTDIKVVPPSFLQRLEDRYAFHNFSVPMCKHHWGDWQRRCMEMRKKISSISGIIFPTDKLIKLASCLLLHDEHLPQRRREGVLNELSVELNIPAGEIKDGDLERLIDNERAKPKFEELVVATLKTHDQIERFIDLWRQSFKEFLKPSRRELRRRGLENESSIT